MIAAVLFFNRYPGSMRPNVIIIGAQKCGTSALHNYLELHPDISMSRPKELDFFIENRNWNRGLDWYEQHWPEDTLVRGEASPNYTSFPKKQRVAEKMASIVPDAKLIYLVRDPIARLVSQHMHEDAKGKVRRDFRTTVFDSSCGYLDRSRYMLQLEQFLPHYDRKNLLIIDATDLRRDRAAALRRVFRFLGVDEHFTSDSFYLDKHKSSEKQRLNPVGRLAAKTLPRSLFKRMQRRLPLGKPVERPVLDDQLRSELAKRLKEDTDRFREFTGNPFADWQV